MVDRRKIMGILRLQFPVSSKKVIYDFYSKKTGLGTNKVIKLDAVTEFTNK